jgi:hypothetical protein
MHHASAWHFKVFLQLAGAAAEGMQCVLDAVLQVFQKAPGVVKMVMPRWSLEEIMLGLEHVYPATNYPGMTPARVQNLFTYYDGVPRFVLGQPSEISGPEADQKDLHNFNCAVTNCNAAQVCVCGQPTGMVLPWSKGQHIGVWNLAHVLGLQHVACCHFSKTLTILH